jgi:hypothetical protein
VGPQRYILIAPHAPHAKQNTVRKSGKLSECWIKKRIASFATEEKLCIYMRHKDKDEDNGERGSFSPHALLINATLALSVFTLVDYILFILDFALFLNWSLEQNIICGRFSSLEKYFA